MRRTRPAPPPIQVQLLDSLRTLGGAGRGSRAVLAAACPRFLEPGLESGAGASRQPCAPAEARGARSLQDTVEEGRGGAVGIHKPDVPSVSTSSKVRGFTPNALLVARCARMKQLRARRVVGVGLQQPAFVFGFGSSSDSGNKQCTGLGPRECIACNCCGGSPS